MSKTSQRKNSYYQSGYKVGRYGWPDGVKSYLFVGGGKDYFDMGYQAGLKDRAKDLAAQAEAKKSERWHNRLLAWLAQRLSR